MGWLVPALIVLATGAAIEGIAWASHKHVVHGFAWAWHRDHREPHDRALERNDPFGSVGAALSFGFVLARDPAMLSAELKRQREEGAAQVRQPASAMGR